MIQSPVGRNTLAVLVLLTVLASWAVFRLETSEPEVQTFQVTQPVVCPQIETETALARMPAPETSPGWVLFDSNASGQLSRDTHFAFEHPAGWNKDSFANHSYATTIVADYDLTKTVPDPEREGVGRQYVPKEYCRIIVKSSTDASAPEVSYQNTYITPELNTACAAILEKVEKTFWYDFK